jgi:plasmid stabilization system protein ParE
VKKYHIALTEQARTDLRDLAHTITETYKSPQTAVRYLRGIFREIRRLSNAAEAYQIQTNLSFSQYGSNVRRVNYKKMAIIYTVLEDTVYIRRVISASLIVEL